MIMQWYWARTATTAPGARELGLARESARHLYRWRRNKDQWQPHLEASRQFMLCAAREAAGTGLVLVAGSGWCLDVPLNDLSRLFSRVVLLDAVHPLPVRREAERLGNVELIHADLTGTLAGIAQDDQNLPGMAFPSLPPGLSPDLTISANTLSSLPLAPQERLWRSGRFSDALLETYATEVIRNHLAWLESLGGLRCLLTDLAWISVDSTGHALTTDPLYDVRPSPPRERWEWRYAPRPQAHPEREIVHAVGASLY